MTYLLLHNGAAATLLGDDPVVPAEEVPTLRRALDVLKAADSAVEAAEQMAAAAKEASHARGRDEGLEAGRSAASTELRSKLFELEVKSAAMRSAQRTEATRLALEIVRRIAGEVGSAEFVSGLAERAARDLLPETRATVRIAPDAHDAVAARLAGLDQLTVQVDPALAADDCEVETAAGSIHAGLETQLAAIERAWATSGETRDG